jgi:Na+/H+ antiporter NhaC
MIFLQIISDSTAVITKQVIYPLVEINYWKFFALFELLLITFLLFIIIRLNKPKPSSEIDDSKSNVIDMDNLILSINGSKKLYKELVVLYHPDRFLDKEKQAFAEQLCKEITENKHNYNKLLELKQEGLKHLK